MTTLVVTEERSFAAAAQHPLLKLFYRGYFFLLRRVLRYQVNRLVQRGPVVVLTNRALGSAVNSIPGVDVRYFDAVQERLPYRRLRERTWREVRTFSASLRSYPELTVSGIFLPEVFETQLVLHLLNGVVKHQAILDELIHQANPNQVVVLTSRSASELAARYLAHQRHIPVAAARTFGLGYLGELVDQYLSRREKSVWHDSLRRLRSEAVAPPARTGDIFLVAAQAGHHLKILAPLARKLEERHRVPTLVLADLPDLAETIKRFSEPPSAWSTVVRYLDPGALDDHLAAASSKFRALHHRLTGAESFKQYPVSEAMAFVRNLFVYDFALASVFIPGIQRLFAERQPRAVITASDRRLNEVLFPMVARQQGVPSVLATAITNMSLEMANDYSTCEVIAVAGDYIRDFMVSIGREPSRVVVVGDLRFDDLPERAQRFRGEQLRTELSLSADQPVVALMSSDIGPTWTETKKRKLFQTVNRAVHRVGSAQLLIKAHPNESVELLKKHMREWGMAEVPVSSADHIHDVMLLSKVVVMLYSMAGLEAMLLGRPVMNVTLEGEDVEHYIPYVTGGGAIGVKTESELAPALSLLLRDQASYQTWVENGKRFVSRFIQLPDGKVSDRILAVVKDLERRRSR